MQAGGIISYGQLEGLIKQNPNIRNGCVLDTNILISSITPSDQMADIVDELLEELRLLKIPTYSNINIRAEFLEIQRKILIPESLSEFYTQARSHLDFDEELTAKMKSVYTSHKDSVDKNKVYKFTDDRIKEWRTLLSKRNFHGQDGWSYFCENIFSPQMTTIWDHVVETCQLNFIKTKEGNNHPLLTTKMSWRGVGRLMGNYGLSSADAMILNLLLSSKIEMIATGDGDIRYMANTLKEQGKFVIEI